MKCHVHIHVYITKIQKGHIGIVEKAQETSSDTVPCDCIVAALYTYVRMYYIIHMLEVAMQQVCMSVSCQMLYIHVHS